MALELFAGAGLGVLFGELQKEICRVKRNFEIFKPKLEELEGTLALLYPVIQEIEELNKRLNRPNHGGETIKLRTLLEDGIKLVSKCSKIPSWKQGRYGGKLVELEYKILKFHNLYLLAPMARDQKQNLLFSQETREMMIMFLNQQGFSNLTMRFTDPSDLTAASSTGSSNLSTFAESNTSGSSSDAFAVLKQTIAIKVGVSCFKHMVKAMKLAAAAQGVESLQLLRGKDGVMVTGIAVDTKGLINSMRKKIGHAQLLSLEDVTPNEGGGGSDNGGFLHTITIKVDLSDARRRMKALKHVAGTSGVEKLDTLNGEDGIIVTGQIDAVWLIQSMRKKFGHATLMSVQKVIPNEGGGSSDGGSNNEEETSP